MKPGKERNSSSSYCGALLDYIQYNKTDDIIYELEKKTVLARLIGAKNRCSEFSGDNYEEIDDIKIEWAE